MILSVGGFEEELKVLEKLVAEEKAKGTEDGDEAEVKAIEKDGMEA